MTTDVFISFEGGLFIHKDNFPIHDQFKSAIAMEFPLKNEKASGYYPLHYQTNSVFLRYIKHGLYRKCRFYILSELFEADVMEQLLEESFQIINLKKNIFLVGASLYPLISYGKKPIEWKALDPKHFIRRTLDNSREIDPVGHTNKIYHTINQLQLKMGGFLSDVYLIDSDTPRLLRAIIEDLNIIDVFSSAYVAEIRKFQAALLPDPVRKLAALDLSGKTMQKLL